MSEKSQLRYHITLEILETTISAIFHLYISHKCHNIAKAEQVDGLFMSKTYHNQLRTEFFLLTSCKVWDEDIQMHSS